MVACCRASLLPESLRRILAPHFPALDLSEVRIHRHIPWYVKRFAVIAPAAYTRGRNIYFAPDCYDPRSVEGVALIAHELVHCQQYRKIGALRFPAAYLQHYFRNKKSGLSVSEAYEEIPFEREACDKEAEVLADPAIRAYCAAGGQ